MNATPKIIQVVPYNPDWPKRFEEEADVIREALKENLLAIHHIGSTAVPGLAAKPTLDIICVLKDPSKAIEHLESIGYQYKGEWNIPFKYGFTRRGDLKVNLHAYEEGHPEIEVNLLFRDYLRQHPQARDAYANLKYALLEDEASFEKNNALFAGYTLGKGPFINDILKKAGFTRLRFLRCAHPAEWEDYHRIREEILFAPRHIVYDRTHPSLTSDAHFHFVLSAGTQIVSVAMVEFLSEHEAALRTFATDSPFRNQGFGAYMIKSLEKWIKHHGRHTIKLHSTLGAEHFYRNLGYTDISFDDPCICKDIVDLGKQL